MSKKINKFKKELDKNYLTEHELVERALDLACIIASMKYEHLPPCNFDTSSIERRARVDNRQPMIGA